MMFSHSQGPASGSWLAPILRDRYYRILSKSAVPQLRGGKTLEVCSKGESKEMLGTSRVYTFYQREIVVYY